MKLSLTIQTPEVPLTVPVTLLSGTLEEKLHKAACMRAAGVELVTTNPDLLDHAWLRDLLLQNKLEVAAISSGGMAYAARLTLLNPDPQVALIAHQRLHDLIDLAFHLDATVVTVGSFRGWGIGDKDQSLEKLTAILRQAGDYAGEHNVVIAIEPLNRFESDLVNNASQGITLLEQVGHPAVGLLLDTFHMNIEESSWIEPFRQVIGIGKLFHVHLGDNNRLPPGRGLIDFVPITEILYKAGYSGFLSAELLAQPDADTAAQQTLAYMQPIIERLSKK